MITLHYQQPVNRRRLIPAAILVLASFVLPDAERLYRLAEITGTPIEWLLSAGRPMMDSTGRPMMTSTGQPRQADGASDDCCCGAECFVCDSDSDTYTITFAGITYGCANCMPGNTSRRVVSGTVNGTYTVTRTTDCTWVYNAAGEGLPIDFFTFSGSCSGPPDASALAADTTLDISVAKTGFTELQISMGQINGAGLGASTFFEALSIVTASGECHIASAINNDFTALDGCNGIYGYNGTATIS
jgi:hypothetical protein